MVLQRSNLAAVKVYTRKGDDGSTGLFYGGRVAKDDTGPEAYGTTDEAVAALGVARAMAADSEPELAGMLLDLQRQMFVVGAELATAPENRHKLEPGTTLVSAEMVTPLEEAIDRIEVERGMPTEFVVPGQNPLAAALDQARTIVRRRRAAGGDPCQGARDRRVPGRALPQPARRLPVDGGTPGRAGLGVEQGRCSGMSFKVRTAPSVDAAKADVLVVPVLGRA